MAKHMIGQMVLPANEWGGEEATPRRPVYSLEPRPRETETSDLRIPGKKKARVSMFSGVMCDAQQSRGDAHC